MTSNIFSYPPKFSNIVNSNARINVVYGSRSSSKTHTAVTLILLLVMKTGGGAMIFRLIEDSLQRSIYATFKKIIQGNEILSQNFTILSNSIRCNTNGAVIDFMGIWNKKEGLKGIDNKKYFLIDEAVDLSREDGLILKNTFARFEDIRIFYLFNPRHADDFVYDQFVTHYKEVKQVWGDDFQILKINWYDNPFVCENESFLKEVEQDKKTLTSEEFNHQWEGELITINNAQIFNKKFEVLAFDTMDRAKVFEKRYFYGADWGFAADPTVMIRCYIYDNNLFIDYEAYGLHVELLDIPKTLFERVPDSKQHTIYGDCANPETISLLKNTFGYKIEPAPKWANSVKEGIEYIRTFKKIYIHPRCVQTINEFKMYSYAIDRHSGEIKSDVADKWNHCIDALRYALSKYIKKETAGHLNLINNWNN